MKTILSVLVICLCIGCQKKTSGPFDWIDYPTNNRSNPVADNEVLKALGLK